MGEVQTPVRAGWPPHQLGLGCGPRLRGVRVCARQFGALPARVASRQCSSHAQYPRVRNGRMKNPVQLDHLAVFASGLTKTYRRGREEVHALQNVSLEVRQGEFLAVVGPSGAGKSTLLNLVGCMDAPTSGSLRLLGQPTEHLTETQRTVFRRDQLGFVFQHFGLLPTLTVAENVA